MSSTQIKVRPVHTGTSPGSPYPKATSRIMGDHLRALQYVIETYGKRGGFQRTIEIESL